MEKNAHKIFLLVGPSGVGKNVILEGVIKRMPQLKRLPSFTTRPPRRTEKEGRDYFFVSLDEFRRLIRDKQLLEHQEVHAGIFYGTPLRKIEDLIKTHDLIKHIDILGAQSLKQAFPGETVSIFVKPPSLKELRRRLKNRANIKENELEDRLKRVSFEMQKADSADYIVINDKLPQCIDEVVMIIRKEMKR